MKKIHKIYKFTLMIIVLFALAGCGVYTKKIEGNKKLYITIEENIVINNDFANIKITQYEGSMAKLEIIKEIKGENKEKVKDVFNNFDIVIKKKDGNIVINTLGLDTIDSSILDHNVSCKILLPNKINDLKINNISGNTVIKGDFKNVEGKVVKGDLIIMGKIGNQNISNVEGKVIINNEEIN